jgi:lambda repressor-like predicted transcriptional regulator
MELTASQKIEKLGKAVSGMTQAELSRAVGVSRERIRQLMPRLKMKPSRRIRAWHRTVSRRTCTAMANLHDRGESLSAIGRTYGVSDYHVREAIRQVRREIQRLCRQEAIRKLLGRGMAFEQACDKLGFSGLQRRRYRRQMGFRWEGVRTVPARQRGRK